MNYRTSEFVRHLDLLNKRRQMIAALGAATWRALADQVPPPPQLDYAERIYSIVYPALVYDRLTPTSIVIADLGRNVDSSSYIQILARALELLSGGDTVLE
jgi:hypothetical protein